MTGIVNPREMTDALIVLLDTIDNLGVGDTDAPDDAALPFCEVSMLPAGRDAPDDYSQQLSSLYLNYQLLVAGQSRASAEHYAHAVMDKIFDTGAPGTGYTNAIPMTNHTCAGRQLTSLIGAADSGRAKAFILHVRFFVHRSTP